MNKIYCLYECHSEDGRGPEAWVRNTPLPKDAKRWLKVGNLSPYVSRSVMIVTDTTVRTTRDEANIIV